MRFTLLGLTLLWAFTAVAEEKVSFKNDREGKSYYQSHSVKEAHARALRQARSSDIVKFFTQTVGEFKEGKLCSYDVNYRLKTRLKIINPKFYELTGALHHLRSLNEMDDVTLKLLLKADAVESTELEFPKREDDLKLPKNRSKLPDMLKAIAKAPGSLKGGCLDEVYRTLYSEVLKVDKKVKNHHVEALLVEAYKAKLLSSRAYIQLEKARVNKVEKDALDLKSYYSKMKSLRTHFPLRDASERSEFATKKFNKKGSRRQRLLEQYTDLQIMLMGDVVKKLRSRLESDKMEILVYAKPDEVAEVISLDPMERFRFSLKILRKEMAGLASNTYFKGVSPSYMDLMTAAYETSIIPASELEELAGLEEIWSPKKTFWEKAKVWAQTFASVGAIIIPPPYGFVPALALMAIEFTVGNKKRNENNTSLF